MDVFWEEICFVIKQDSGGPTSPFKQVWTRKIEVLECFSTKASEGQDVKIRAEATNFAQLRDTHQKCPVLVTSSGPLILPATAGFFHGM